MFFVLLNFSAARRPKIASECFVSDRIKTMSIKQKDLNKKAEKKEETENVLSVLSSIANTQTIAKPLAM